MAHTHQPTDEELDALIAASEEMCGNALAAIEAWGDTLPATIANRTQGSLREWVEAMEACVEEVTALRAGGHLPTIAELESLMAGWQAAKDAAEAEVEACQNMLSDAVYEEVEDFVAGRLKALTLAYNALNGLLEE